jgi:hypothetical protein
MLEEVKTPLVYGEDVLGLAALAKLYDGFPGMTNFITYNPVRRVSFELGATDMGERNAFIDSFIQEAIQISWAAYNLLAPIGSMIFPLVKTEEETLVRYYVVTFKIAAALTSDSIAEDMKLFAPLGKVAYIYRLNRSSLFRLKTEWGIEQFPLSQLNDHIPALLSLENPKLVFEELMKIVGAQLISINQQAKGNT